MYKKIIFLMLMTASFLYADKYEDVKSAGILNIGVKYDFRPFGYLDTKGRLVGFDIDMAKLLARKLRVSIKFFQVTSKNRIPRLLRKDIDIIVASMTHKVSRDKDIDFSISYFFDGQSILASVDEMGTSYKDFKNRKVGAVRGSTSGVQFKKLVPKSQIIYFTEYPQALRALKKGNIDAITTDYVWCMTQEKSSNGTLKVIGEKLSYEPYAVGIPQNESRLRDSINFAIQAIVKEGLYSEVYEKWFGEKPKKLPILWPN